MTTPPDGDLQLGLLRFSRMFSTLIEAGVSLVRALDLLAGEMPAPYAALAADVRDRVCAGATLTQALEQWPELISPLYLRLVRAGEVGGILDETLNFMVELLEDEYRLLPEQTSVLLPGRQVTTWEELAPPQRLLHTVIFCRTFGLLLSAGVPTDMALATAGGVLPAVQRQGVEAVARGDVLAGMAEPLAALGFLPTPVIQLLQVGESCAELDFLALKAAQVYRDELRYLHGQLTQTREEHFVPGHVTHRVRLQGGPIPAELAERELRFVTEQLRQAGGEVPADLPPAGGQRMALLVIRLLQWGLQRGAEVLELRRVAGDGAPYLRVAFRTGDQLADVRHMPIGLYAMLAYRLCAAAQLPNPAFWWRPGSGTMTVTIAGQEHQLTVRVLPRPNAGVTEVDLRNGG